MAQCLVVPAPSTAAPVVTEILDSSGDGLGAEFHEPGDASVAVTAGGDVYATGRVSHNAFRISGSGEITEIINASGDEAGHILTYPEGVAVDAAGTAFVTGHDSDNLFRITVEGEVSELIDATGDGLGNVLDRPHNVAVDNTGNVFVSGLNSDNVFRISPEGVIMEIVDATGDGKGGLLDHAGALAVAGTGDVFVAGIGTDNVLKISPDGSVKEILDASGDGQGHPLDGPSRIAADSLGNVFVTGAASDNVFHVAPSGAVQLIMDATGDGNGNTLDSPDGIAVDTEGSIFVAGIQSDNVFQIRRNGTVRVLVDATGAGPLMSLNAPRGVDVDGDGTVYVSGGSSNNVLAIEPDAPMTSRGVSARKLVIADKVAARSKAKVAYVSKDSNTEIAKWGELSPEAIGVTLVVAYAGAQGSAAGAFVLPSGGFDGTSGWVTKGGVLAKYINKQAPDGPTQAKVGVIRPGRGLKLVGKGLGDAPIDVFGAGAPTTQSFGQVLTAYCVDDGGQETCHCTAFPECSYKLIAADTGAKLVCKNGVPDPACTAVGDP
jgi:sugar lactone lactonase YvrE